MAKIKETYNNLIDVCILLEENPEYTGKAKEMFRYLLTDYFFKQDVSQSKGIEFLFNDLPLPAFLDGKQSLLKVSLDDIKAYIEGTTINDSISGKIMLSTPYLKHYFPHHPPTFSKLPEDIKFELIDKIKERNNSIVAAFEKMSRDRDADKKRKIITLIALIFKNICMKTDRPMATLTVSLETLIKNKFGIANEVFNGSQRQIAELGDDTKIKELIKTIFVIRQFNDINELVKMYKDELSRYRKRGIKIGSN